jgi:hypothetical protein
VLAVGSEINAVALPQNDWLVAVDLGDDRTAQDVDELFALVLRVLGLAAARLEPDDDWHHSPLRVHCEERDVDSFRGRRKVPFLAVADD